MNAVLEFLQTAGIVTLGLLTRLLLFALFLGVVTAPVVAIQAVWQGIRRLRQRRHGATFLAI
jgi:hypothetical protein